MLSRSSKSGRRVKGGNTPNPNAKLQRAVSVIRSSN
jgi:hypothetical protein